jgi:hypothetical protein
MTLLALAFSVALVQAGDTTPPQQVSSHTCEIHGRVTDKETGRAIPRVIVRLHVGEDRLVAGTDDEGRYEFKGLAPGRYSGEVDPGDFRATYIAASLAAPGDTTGQSVIILKDGDRAEVNVALQRTLAITVRVVNEWGEPLAGVDVTANSESDMSSLHRSMFRATDDRGRVRLFEMAPGRYMVCAAPDRVSPFTDSSDTLRERYLRTCYPSAASEAEAEPVAVDRSNIADLEIRMRRGHTYRISGTVFDASGAAASGASLGFTRVDGTTSSGFGAPVDDSGRFTATNVPPGEYALVASIGGPDRPEQRRPFERGFLRVRVEASDVDGLIVVTAKAVDVAGRVVLDHPATPLQRRAGYTRLLIDARPAGEPIPWGIGTERTVSGDDGVFVLPTLAGLRVLDVVDVPTGWYVKSIRYRGEEIMDVPTEFKAGQDPSELQVILSTRGAILSGRALDDRGDPVSGARVVLLPADPSRWTMFQLTRAISSASGMFQVGPLRAGEYLIVALSPSAPSVDPRDRVRLTQLLETAERITLASEEQRTLDLHIVKDR